MDFSSRRKRTLAKIHFIEYNLGGIDTLEIAYATAPRKKEMIEHVLSRLNAEVEDNNVWFTSELSKTAEDAEANEYYISLLNEGIEKNNALKNKLAVKQNGLRSLQQLAYDVVKENNLEPRTMEEEYALSVQNKGGRKKKSRRRRRTRRMSRKH